MTVAKDVSLFESMESEVRRYCRTFPAVFHRAKDARLYAEDGREFIDFFCGAGTLNFGHNNDFIKRRLLAYMAEDGLAHGLDLYTTAKRDLLSRLHDVVLAPRGLDYKVQFCGPTGTDAVEAALKLARKATGRPGIVSFSGAYHGMSRGSLAVTGSRAARAAGSVGSSSDVVFVPYEDGPSGPFDSIAYLSRMFADPASGMDIPAAIIVEPLQMEGGIYSASPSWLRALRDLTSRHGVLLICDEIQSGCGRTGTFFSFEPAAIQPDIVTVSKSISGYGLPLALTLFHRSLDVWAPGEHTGTFRGNQHAFVTATAALDLWSTPTFQTRLSSAITTLDTFATHLRALDLVVRSRGMVLGVDLDPLRAELTQRACFAQGLILELCGRHNETLKIMPPLTIDPPTLNRGLDILRTTLRGAPIPPKCDEGRLRHAGREQPMRA